MSSTASRRQPALFLGHGSPMNAIEDSTERRAWAELGRRLAAPEWRPRAVLCISAHWETHGATHLTSGANPRTIHDFRGFPPALHAVQYPAPGAEWLVKLVRELAGEAATRADASWGFDHGSWGVVMPMFPDAGIPLVQLSLDRALDGRGHLALAARLAPLRDEGVLIVGSGNIVHNLHLFFNPPPTGPGWADPFARRILDAAVANDHAALVDFAPDDELATLAINSGEHYLPLLYPLGARLPGDGVAVFNDSGSPGLAMACVLVGDAALAADL
ncbi:MAG: dioxygenase [Proteobacteria bacterium]|nr:dioxygenase [Pseudomonadota bacterium]